MSDPIDPYELLARLGPEAERGGSHEWSREELDAVLGEVDRQAQRLRRAYARMRDVSRFYGDFVHDAWAAGVPWSLLHRASGKGEAIFARQLDAAKRRAAERGDDGG